MCTPKIPKIESEKSISVVKAVQEPSEPHRKATKIIQPTYKNPGLIPEIPVINSEESIIVKQEPPEEQILSDFTNFENKNLENAKIKDEIEPRNEYQFKESIEIKDELALDLENSNLKLDYQAWSKNSENEESAKSID